MIRKMFSNMIRHINGIAFYVLLWFKSPLPLSKLTEPAGSARYQPVTACTVYSAISALAKKQLHQTQTMKNKKEN